MTYANERFERRGEERRGEERRRGERRGEEGRERRGQKSVVFWPEFSGCYQAEEKKQELEIA